MMLSVLFDYGGTLDSDGITWLERFYFLYRANGINIERNVFDRAFYDSDDNLPQRHALNGLNLEQTVRLQIQDVMKVIAPKQMDLADRIAEQFSKESRDHIVRLTPVLKKLSQRYRLGIVSNFYGNLDGILEAEGLRDLFGVVADSGRLGVLKPDPEIFLHAARSLNSAANDCVMIGDSMARDIRGAKAAGMKRVLINSKTPAPLGDQDWTVCSVLELEKILT